MPNCDGCGAHVSQTFYRVNSVNGEINGCPKCSEWSDRSGGAA